MQRASTKRVQRRACYGSGAALREHSGIGVATYALASSCFAASCGMVIGFRCTGMITSQCAIHASSRDLSTPTLRSSPSLGLSRCHRELAVAGLRKKLRVQQCDNDCVPRLRIDTEQALRLGRREPETRHLTIFCADSAQHFFGYNVRTRTCGHKVGPFNTMSGRAANEEWRISTPCASANFSGARGGDGQRARAPATRRDGATRLAALTYPATATLYRLGLASSRIGSRTVSTPALYWALTLPPSTVGGRANVRANEP